MRQLLLALLLAGGVAVSGHAQTPDSSAAGGVDTSAAAGEANWLVLPYASYTPATKIAAGGAAGYYLPDTPQQSPSSVELTLTVTQRRQVTVAIDPELYLSRGRWRVEGALRGSKYPSSFHGIGGDTPAAAKESYTERYGTFDLTVQRRLRPHLYLGPRVFVRTSAVTDPDDGGLLDDERVAGAEGGVTAGLGAAARWDARDNVYYPTDGNYAEVVGTWYSTAWRSDHTYGHFKTDLRGYRPVGPGVLAAQAYAETVVGDAPFLLLPLLGGSDRMRGYRKGRFRDDMLWAAQTEYRVPLFWRFKGTVFVSAGEVGPRIGATLFEEIETAAGVGGRFRLTEDGIHGRLDVAYGRTGFEIYMSLGEAF